MNHPNWGTLDGCDLWKSICLHRVDTNPTLILLSFHWVSDGKHNSQIVLWHVRKKVLMKSILISGKIGYNLSTVFPGILRVIKHETRKSTCPHCLPSLPPLTPPKKNPKPKPNPNKPNPLFKKYQQTKPNQQQQQPPN